MDLILFLIKVLSVSYLSTVNICIGQLALPLLLPVAFVTFVIYSVFLFCNFISIEKSARAVSRAGACICADLHVFTAHIHGSDTSYLSHTKLLRKTGVKVSFYYLSSNVDPGTDSTLFYNPRVSQHSFVFPI